jgi:hypothetical protein
MKNWKLTFGIILLLVVLAFVSQEECGGNERWDVKTLQDSLAHKINFTPKQTTVGNLTTLRHVEKVGNHTERFGNEFVCYQIDCRIREYRLEEDGDYHLVLVDMKDSSKTIIGEIPDFNCEKVKTSKFIKNFIDARVTFQKYILPKHGVKDGVYTITGVCFYDKIHGQLGVCKDNGLELHPIMDIIKQR